MRTYKEVDVNVCWGIEEKEQGKWPPGPMVGGTSIVPHALVWLKTCPHHDLSSLTHNAHYHILFN